MQGAGRRAHHDSLLALWSVLGHHGKRGDARGLIILVGHGLIILELALLAPHLDVAIKPSCGEFGLGSGLRPGEERSDRGYVENWKGKRRVVPVTRKIASPSLTMLSDIKAAVWAVLIVKSGAGDAFASPYP